MLSPAELYPLIDAWLQGLGLSRVVARAALGQLVTALLVGQSLRPSALMRALESPTAAPARQRYKRVRRARVRPWLAPAWLTPRLVRAVTALGPRTGDGTLTLALDSVRCGGWELLTVGVVWHGRAVVVGWAVLPYPWPKGRFTPTTCALLERVGATWPPDRPAHLVADRGFPSGALFRTLRRLGWGRTVRLSARTYLTVDGRPERAGARVATAAVGRWTTAPAAFGGVVGALVVGRGLPVLAAHQRTDGSLRHRAAQQPRRRRRLANKHPAQPPDRSAATDAWVLLFTTCTDPWAAGRAYTRRWAIEGTDRDAQGGWDGRHGWDLEPTVAHLGTATDVEAVAGLWALGALLQIWVGHTLGHAPPPTRAVLAAWTTTGRLSVWARGRLALTDPSGRLRPWLAVTLDDGARRLASYPPTPLPIAA
jgi:hypothetical protein